MPTYGQYCPVAKAMELLDERWTMLIVRDLLAGSAHFNDLRRSNPKMSPALLTKRLRGLERAGVIRRRTEDGRTGYELTPCGEELAPAVEALGAWGIRWIGELGEADLDPHLLMWDIRRSLSLDAWPRERTVVAFEFDDVPPRIAYWWLCVSGDEVDVCDFDPGYDVSATISTSLRTLVEVWRGDQSWMQAVSREELDIAGQRTAARDVPRWLGQMSVAAVPRPV